MREKTAGSPPRVVWYNVRLGCLRRWVASINRETQARFLDGALRGWDVFAGGWRPPAESRKLVALGGRDAFAGGWRPNAYFAVVGLLCSCVLVLLLWRWLAGLGWAELGRVGLSWAARTAQTHTLITTTRVPPL